MSNNHGTRFEGFIPGQINVVGDSKTENVIFDLPGDREAAVQIRTQIDDPAVRAKHREEFLTTVYPPSLTEGLERDIARLTTQFNDFTGYDKQGKPIMRVQGREREVLEMKLANRRSSLQQAQRERALAERLQAQAKATKQAQLERINEAAQARAQQLIEEAEVERRAKQMAARMAGVRD
jgi:multidrug efflux pump subunit AcrA (membrane-fusion protein)